MILRYLGTSGGWEYNFEDALDGRLLSFPNDPEHISVEGQAPLVRGRLYAAPNDALDRIRARPATPADVVAARRSAG